MSLATLSIDLVAKLARFEADMGKAARAAEKTAQQISGAFGLIKSAAGGLVAGLGAGGLVALTKASIDSIDALNDLKDATGASVENISALEDIAARTGTKFDTVGTSLTKFNSVLKDTKPGSDAAAAFKALGLSVQDLKALDPAEALRQTAVALTGFADDGNKARLVQELFGKSVQEVAPFLKDLAEQTKLTATVTTEQAEAAEKFNKQLFEMQKNVQDVARYLSSDLVTAINASGEAFRTGGLWEGLKRLYGGSEQFKLDKQLTELTAQLLTAEKNLQDSRGSDLVVMQNRTKAYQAEIEAIKKQIEGVQTLRKLYDPDNQSAAETARLRGRLPSLPSGGGGRTAGGTPERAKRELDFTNKAAQSLLDSLDRQLEKSQDLTAVEEAYIELTKRGAGVTLEEAAAIYAKARAVDKLREDEERIRISREAAASQGVDNTARADRLRTLLADTDEERFARIRQDIELLAEELTSGRLEGGTEQYAQAIKRLIGETATTVDKARSAVDDLGLSFASAFEDAVVGGKAVQDVLKGIGQDLLRLTVRKSITQPLADYFSGTIGSLFSFDGGGYTGSGPRVGGLDGKGGFLAMMHPQESIIDHASGGRAAPVVNLYLTQNHGALVTPAELARSNDMLVRQIQVGLLRSQRYDGALAA